MIVHFIYFGLAPLPNLLLLPLLITKTQPEILTIVPKGISLSNKVVDIGEGEVCNLLLSIYVVAVDLENEMLFWSLDEVERSTSGTWEKLFMWEFTGRGLSVEDDESFEEEGSILLAPHDTLAEIWVWMVVELLASLWTELLLEDGRERPFVPGNNGNDVDANWLKVEEERIPCPFAEDIVRPTIRGVEWLIPAKGELFLRETEGIFKLEDDGIIFRVDGNLLNEEEEEIV